MKPVEKWKTWTFIGSLALIVAIVEGFKQSGQKQESVSSIRTAERVQETTQSPLQQAQQATLPRPKTPEELKAEREQFRARIMNERPSPIPGVKTVAIVVVDDKRKLNGTLAGQIAKKVNVEGIRTFTSLFTPEFVSENLFKAAFDDSPKPIEDLELKGMLDSLLLAEETIEYETNPSLENVITASLQLEVRLVSIARRGDSRSWRFVASGPGFKEADARKAAEDRLAKQIANDTNFVISPNL